MNLLGIKFKYEQKILRELVYFSTMMEM